MSNKTKQIPQTFEEVEKLLEHDQRVKVAGKKNIISLSIILTR